MKPIQIAKLFNISPQKVNYWVHHPIIYHRKRRTKLTRNERNIIIRWAKNKPVNIASSKIIQRKFNYLSKSKKEDNKPKKVSLSTINKTLNNFISKPKKMRKVFVLTENNKKQRMNFLKFMEKNNISPEDIFFTDESQFNLSFLNGHSKIRITKKVQDGLKRGNERAINLIVRPTQKKVNGIMISGGISKNGLGKLIFHSGNVNTFSYKQVLKFYKEDFINLGCKFFQQDGAKVHSSKNSCIEIKNLFGNNFIPTWDDGPKFNGATIPRWPPNSPDLSPIEIIWSIIKGMLSMFPPSNLDELKSSIKKIWESIPAEICKNIINHFKERWKLCAIHKGRRLDKELLAKIPSTHRDIKWKVKNCSIEGVRVSYNDKFVERLKAKEIRGKNKKIKELKEIEKDKKKKYDKLMNLKPKDYKNIPDQEKYEIRFAYDYAKIQREMMEKNVQEIEEKTPLQYLETLNDETKKKLIGLCLDKKIVEFLDSSDETDYDEDEDSLEEEEMD